MFNTLAATALVAAGAAALNQLLEREYDAKMRRTQSRPLPSGRLQPTTVAIFGGVSSVAGLVYLALAVNLLTSVLGAVTLISYLFIYTPLKRVTWLNTAIGAIPGALPPLMGWTAARNELSGEGWALFAILAFWQIPHFFAIAWMYRDEYAKAGFVMLPNVDARRQTHGAANREPRACAADREPVPVRVQNGRDGLSRQRDHLRRRHFCVVRSNFRGSSRWRARGNCFWLQSFICRCCWRRWFGTR